VLTACTFIGNSAEYGGGIYNSQSSPALANCTLAGNSAVNGGGIYSSALSAPALTNCTLWANSALLGSGLYSQLSSPVLTNCILWGHFLSAIHNQDSSPIIIHSDIQGGYAGEGNIDADPRFADPDNGDFHLSVCSPCIDAGDNDAPDLPGYDFEGDDRILDGSGNGTATVDMGVDEVAVAGTCLRIYLPLILRDL
jgi:predicted outer membrane repeat protein